MKPSNNLNHCKTSNNRNEIVSIEDIFDVLTAPERRAVLYALCNQSKPIDVDELSRKVASADVGNTRNSPEQIKPILHHVHLPKLEQFSLVEYDRDLGTVEIKRLPRRLKRYLQFTAADEMEACLEDVTA
ncbi:DUF7344 domain-containing protein [Haladaptatus pallidirubidus]|nr:hypothetical protein [Haladaptatus pallidirubidus]